MPFIVSGSGFPAGVTISLTLVAQTGPTPAAARTDANGRAALAPGSIRLVGATAAGDEVSLGTTTAAADGTFSREVAVPANTAPGFYIVRASYLQVVAETQIEVLGESAVSPTPGANPSEGATPARAAALPRTGSNAIPLLRVGAGLLAIGGVVLLADRRRRHLIGRQ